MMEHVRGVLVAAHVLAVLILALPSTGGLLHRPAWKAPSVQQEFASWAGLLSAIGPDWTSAELESTLWRVVKGYSAVNGWVSAPVAPYRRWLGTGQSWQMFPAPERFPAPLHVEIEEPTASGTRWRTVYVGRSTEHTWQREVFDQDRMRTLTYLYSWPHMRKHSVDLAAWLAPRAAADFPEATRLRLRFRRYRTPSPEDVLAGRIPEGKLEPGAVVDLRDLR